MLPERRRPVGVIGANFEARPNVTVDIASQLVKSRNAGVLRTGSAALGSAMALMDEVVAPALADGRPRPGARSSWSARPAAAAAYALVCQPDLVPLVILRGSGDSTRGLAAEAARRTASGPWPTPTAAACSTSTRRRDAASCRRADRRTSLDRLGVCNRLNLLLHRPAAVETRCCPASPTLLDRPRRSRRRCRRTTTRSATSGRWTPSREATVTVAPAAGPAEAAAIANDETSGLAAGDRHRGPGDAAAEFLAAYAGTGAFWNATTRLLDGFKLLDVPETGINLDRVPGPRGPVTFRDLSLRQFVVTPR